MKKLVFAAAVLLAFPLAVSAQEDHSGHGGQAAMSGASGEYMKAMQDMDAAMRNMAMSGDAAVDFAAMMIPHHQAAIEMAKSYLASGDNDPELTKLSEEIVAAQEREIAQLEAWLAKNRAQ
jgi:uncharacterized protein (DUF305 family)